MKHPFTSEAHDHGATCGVWGEATHAPPEAAGSTIASRGRFVPHADAAVETSWQLVALVTGASAAQVAEHADDPEA